MNQHIEPVKKYLEDSDSVTIEKLRGNREAAYAAMAANVAAAPSYEKAMEYVREYEELTESMSP